MVKKYSVSVNGKKYEVEVEEIHNNKPDSQTQTDTIKTKQITETNQPVETNTSKVKSVPEQDISNNAGSNSSIEAPMSGLVIDVRVKKGDSVKPGDKLLVLEAMKMENDIVSDIRGIMDEVHCKKGENVETGETLISIS